MEESWVWRRGGMEGRDVWRRWRYGGEGGMEEREVWRRGGMEERKVWWRGRYGGEGGMEEREVWRKREDREGEKDIYSANRIEWISYNLNA